MSDGRLFALLALMNLSGIAFLVHLAAQAQAEPAPSPVPAPLELAEVQHQIDTLRADVARLGVELDDARVLTLIGGPKRKWRGGGVSCDGGPYLPGSHGEAAYRALRATGWCEPSQLPEARRR